MAMATNTTTPNHGSGNRNKDKIHYRETKLVAQYEKGDCKNARADK